MAKKIKAIETEAGSAPAVLPTEEEKTIKCDQATSFKMKDGSVRTFTEADHGMDYIDLAAEFEKTNAHKIIERN